MINNRENNITFSSFLYSTVTLLFLILFTLIFPIILLLKRIISTLKSH